VVIGTVKGDIHDVGKNLVVMMMKGAGFKVIDLGINIPVEKFIDAIKEYQPDIVGMSALLTTTMIEFKKNIEAFKNAGLRDKIKVMVGGAPVNEKYALDSGADAYGGDAIDAVEKAKKLIS
jgi:methylmalonyl-CoA mutase cobalamin-binding domain/chain